MEEKIDREQFTFYRSYYEAIKRLPPEEQGVAALAICAYALDGEEPNSLPPTTEISFILIKPTLDTGRKKAQNGQRGGQANGKQNKSTAEANRKQNRSKQEANAKQNESKKEKEVEIEKENKCYTPKPPRDFDTFWACYPKKVGKEAAKKAFRKVTTPLETLINALETQKRSKQWARDNGQYIPNPSTWLNQGRWEDELDAETVQAANESNAGKRWNICYDVDGTESGNAE